MNKQEQRKYIMASYKKIMKAIKSCVHFEHLENVRNMIKTFVEYADSEECEWEYEILISHMNDSLNQKLKEIT